MRFGSIALWILLDVTFVSFARCLKLGCSSSTLELLCEIHEWIFAPASYFVCLQTTALTLNLTVFSTTIPTCCLTRAWNKLKRFNTSITVTIPFIRREKGDVRKPIRLMTCPPDIQWKRVSTPGEVKVLRRLRVTWRP